jgi:hypothetical protein
MMIYLSRGLLAAVIRPGRRIAVIYVAACLPLRFDRAVGSLSSTSPLACRCDSTGPSAHCHPRRRLQAAPIRAAQSMLCATPRSSTSQQACCSDSTSSTARCHPPRSKHAARIRPAQSMLRATPVSSPSDRSHDVYAIVLLQYPLPPLLARHHFTIDRHRQRLARQIERAYQFLHALPGAQRMRRTIQFNLHRHGATYCLR